LLLTSPSLKRRSLLIRKAFCFALLVLFLSTVHSPSVFSQQPSWKLLPNSPSGGRYDDISFINANTGWTALQRVYKTTDGGLNWMRQDSLPVYMRSIAFFDSLTGFIGALDSVKILWRTTNGGVNWSQVQNIPSPVPKGICGISIADNNTIYACGRFTGPAGVIKSTDRGATWQSIDMSAYATTLIDCKFFSADSGFVVGGFGPTYATRKAVILFTSNGGASWTQKAISTSDSNWCWKISFVNRNVGYVSIETPFSSPEESFFKTTNGGESWLELPYTGTEQGIGFVNDTLGWLGFHFMKQSTDAGLTWNNIDFGMQLPFINRIRFYGDTMGYASGSRIFKYTSDNSIGISNNQGSAPKNYKLYQNYPNPFNPATTIKYEIFEYSMTTIKIYNSVGEEVYVFMNGFRPPGMREFKWDGTNMNGMQLPSGVYFYKLETEKYTETKKMMLVK
jgi:photosystem II stability/assembly factor-like uncharacterized protein